MKSLKTPFIYILLFLAVIAYLTFVLIPIGIIISVPSYFLTKNEVLKFHIIQMAILAITFYLLSVIFLGSGLMFLHFLIFIPYVFIFLIFAILEIIYLIRNKKIKLPLFGEITENFMKGNL
ncbi:MAG: hypothetical protein ACK4NF_03770 [Planctomycetota bacterium]